MQSLGSELWGRSDTIHSVRVVRVLYVGPCEFKRWHCTKPAHTQIEVRNGLGIPFWRRDYCQEHAAPLLEKARAAEIRIFGLGE